MADMQEEGRRQDGRDRLNDTTSYQRCFVCGARNPFGLQLRFRQEGDEVVADFMPEERHQGFPGTVHGGILAALLDETLNRAPVLLGQWVMTARLNLRFRRPAPIGQMLQIRAKLDYVRSRFYTARGAIHLAADSRVIYAEAEGSFLPIPPEITEAVLATYPDLIAWVRPDEQAF
jgi:acyl-coenzyme A thioesterase PaaI-like protein